MSSGDGCRNICAQEAIDQGLVLSTSVPFRCSGNKGIGRVVVRCCGLSGKKNVVKAVKQRRKRKDFPIPARPTMTRIVAGSGLAKSALSCSKRSSWGSPVPSSRRKGCGTRFSRSCQ